MTPIITLIILIASVVTLVYYVRDITSKVTARYFELKDLVNDNEAKLENARSLLQESIKDFRREIREAEKRIKNLEDSIVKKVDELGKRISSIEKELKDLKKKILLIERLNDKIKELSVRIDSIEPENLRKELKEDIKSEILNELRDEIESFEDMLEKKKEEELKEFLDLLTMSINLPPEKVKDGLIQAKLALLSLRDIAKVYVLTGKGIEEFEKLRENLVSFLKEMRKLVVIALPEEDIYSEMTSIIAELKKLKLPLEEKGKELSPEKSFIRVHNMIYDLTSKLDRVAEKIEGPIPVTPIEKEFYEKLKIQFENLKKLEKQVQELLARLGGEIKKEEKRDKIDEIKKILEDLGV
ncbi:hypothetical protein PNA2_1128 [Pyrococcus sp. NA2]|uniref:hypothetical protein n=1 Tax=Pyrococcus sp. (strain NA2) TaxID=342949 RepID=UPI000209AB58|nr:hypothetical protein [Pyrococcus sp. NA2]AEC52044.1 hypothetical protein PNA2_1128 [Pyrococcus sp. NA2]